MNASLSVLFLVISLLTAWLYAKSTHPETPVRRIRLAIFQALALLSLYGMCWALLEWRVDQAQAALERAKASPVVTRLDQIRDQPKLELEGRISARNQIVMPGQGMVAGCKFYFAKKLYKSRYVSGSWLLEKRWNPPLLIELDDGAVRVERIDPCPYDPADMERNSTWIPDQAIIERGLWRGFKPGDPIAITAGPLPRGSKGVQGATLRAWEGRSAQSHDELLGRRMLAVQASESQAGFWQFALGSIFLLVLLVRTNSVLNPPLPVEQP